MDISDITLEMELNGVSDAHIAEILTACKKRGYTPENIDNELQKRGYEALFDDEFGFWGDEEYASVEKMRHKGHHE